MSGEDYALLRSKFLRIFANIPEQIRSTDIIVVIDEKPYTWNNAAFEVRNGTHLGTKIIKILHEKLKIL